MPGKKIRIYILIAFLLITGGVLYYAFRPSPDSVKRIRTDLTLSAEELISDFENDEASANKLYLDKIIVFKGKIVEISIRPEEKTIIYLEGSPIGSISCLFAEGSIIKEDLSMGQIVQIKGKCAGYIQDVIFIKCSIVD